MLFLKPGWPAPLSVLAFTTLRERRGDGDSALLFDNKEGMESRLNAPVLWLNQKHTNQVVCYKSTHSKDEESPLADACYTDLTHCPCAVLTADCLPILLCNTEGTWIAAVHGGWRGLLADIIQNTLNKAPDSTQFLAWLGPAIGPKSYEVGAEVYDAFVSKNPQYSAAFEPVGIKYLLNLYAIAKMQLAQAGVTAVFGGEYCTYSDERFYSYRRGDKTARQATVIMLK